jgi:hypothetical protein
VSSSFDINTTLMFSFIQSFTAEVIGAPRVFAKCQIDREPDLRSWFVGEARAGHIILVAPRIYAHQGSTGSFDTAIAPSAVAYALALENKWRMALPTKMARFLLGLETKPTKHGAFFYDSDAPRHYPNVGLTLDPIADQSVFDLTPAGQAIRLGTQDVLDPMKIREIVNFAASAWFSHAEIRTFLEEDLAAGLLRSREQQLANAILSTVSEGVGREAPGDFKPQDHSDAPKIIDWQIIRDASGNEYLRAAHIHGHAHIRDGRSLGFSTALVWIDERIGWARTRSRYYCLVGPKMR